MTVKSIRHLATSGAVALGLLTAGSTAASAQDEALVSFSVMKPEIAVKLAQVAVAVVDRFGNLQMMLRDRFAGAHTPETARRKAWTAVSFRNDTLALTEIAKPGAEAYGANFITEALMLGGGVPIEAAGSIVGGVGVSGAPGGDMDDACARAGIEAVAADLAF